MGSAYVELANLSDAASDSLVTARAVQQFETTFLAHMEHMRFLS